VFYQRVIAQPGLGVDGRAVTLDLGRAFLGTIEGTTDLQSAAAGCSDTPVMCPLDWTLHTTTEAGYRYLSCSSNFKAPALPLAKSACRPPAAYTATAGGSSPSCQAEPGSNRQWAPQSDARSCPLPETEIPGSQGRRRKGRQVFHRITHEHQRLQSSPAWESTPPI